MSKQTNIAVAVLVGVSICAISFAWDAGNDFKLSESMTLGPIRLSGFNVLFSDLNMIENVNNDLENLTNTFPTDLRHNNQQFD